jgi:4-hydroxy-4-methyl-2-oxoglutarate aldolase
MNFIETKTYSAEDDVKILEPCKNLRVADVSYGLDMAGLPGSGDVVVGDGDGVVVVPRVIAEQVAKYAGEVLSKDKAGRKGLYESLGRPLDKAVKQE